MAPVKIERVISASSEDEAHPASNLLKTDYTNKKWKCKTPGEKQISVVFQLAEFCKIFSIDVGNEHSALIEVLVGKSCSPNDDFKVLLVTSSLMTLQESKYSTNVNGVTFFKEEHLCKPVCEEKWDRVKVVCSQPFNNHVQFGLSFIIFHSDKSSLNPSTCNNIKLKATSSVDSLLKTGGLFANRNKLSVEPAATGAAAIRAAAADVKINFPISDGNKNSTDLKTTTLNDSPRSEEGKKTRNATKNEKAKTPKNDSGAKKKRNVQKDVPAGRTSHNSPPKKKIVLAPVQAFKKREERPFGQLLSGVVFVMSGYENPLRTELRNKALAMGARYEFNWNCNCTHLICAFRNTPKYNQVRGRGKIVKSQWIEECYSRRKRLPWRRFALDRNDASQAESEEEICEKIETPVASTSKEDSESEDDTDDEIEKVRQKQQKLNGSNNIDTPSTSGLNLQSANSSTSEVIPNNEDSTVGQANKVSLPQVKKEFKIKEETNVATDDETMDEDSTADKANSVSSLKVKEESKIKEETNVATDDEAMDEVSTADQGNNVSSLKVKKESKIKEETNVATDDEAMDVDSTPYKANNVSSRKVKKENKIKEETNIATDDAVDNANNVSSRKVKKENKIKEETNVYDMDTESEDENYWVKPKPEENSLPPLPAFLEGATIALLDDLSESDKNLLRRYIKAHKGSIADNKADLNMILYAITEDQTAIERVKEDFPQVMGVTPEWIWRSHDEAKLLPASLFHIK